MPPARSNYSCRCRQGYRGKSQHDQGPRKNPDACRSPGTSWCRARYLVWDDINVNRMTSRLSQKHGCVNHVAGIHPRPDGGEGGIDSHHPWSSPYGRAHHVRRVQTGCPALVTPGILPSAQRAIFALRRCSKFVPDKFVSNPGASHRILKHTDLFGKNEKARSRRAFSFFGGGCSRLRTRLCPFSLITRENTGNISIFLPILSAPYSINIEWPRRTLANSKVVEEINRE